MVDAGVDCERVAARRVAGSSPGKRPRVVCAGRHPAPLTGAETGRERAVGHGAYFQSTIIDGSASVTVTRTGNTAGGTRKRETLATAW